MRSRGCAKSMRLRTLQGNFKAKRSSKNVARCGTRVFHYRVHCPNGSRSSHLDSGDCLVSVSPFPLRRACAPGRYGARGVHCATIAPAANGLVAAPRRHRSPPSARLGESGKPCAHRVRDTGVRDNEPKGYCKGAQRARHPYRGRLGRWHHAQVRRLLARLAG